MSQSGKSRNTSRMKRKLRSRKKLAGTAERPRMSVFRSAAHVSVQVIDDEAGKTLVSVSSFGKGSSIKRANIEECGTLGKKIAEKCKEKNISKVVFDKNGFAYHGRVKAVAEGAREAGLSF